MSHVRDMELIELAAGNLPEELAAELNAHLARCAECQERFAAFRDVHATLGAWRVAAEHIDVLSRVTEETPRVLRLKWTVVGRASRIAAAIVFGVVVGYGAARLGHTSPAVPVTSATDVEQVLALHALETPSPTGLTIALAEIEDAPEEEVSP